MGEAARVQLVLAGMLIGAIAAVLVLSGCAAPPLQAMATPPGVKTTQQSRVFDSPAMFNARYADSPQDYVQPADTSQQSQFTSPYDRPITSGTAWYQYRNDIPKRVYAGYRGPTIETSRVRTYDYFGSSDGNVHDHYRESSTGYRVRVRFR